MTELHLQCEQNARNLTSESVWQVYAPYCDSLTDFAALAKLVSVGDIDLLSSEIKLIAQKIIDRSLKNA